MSTDLKRQRKLGLIISSILVFTATFIILVNEGMKKTVAVTLDGEKVVVKTHAETIGDMLEELDVEVKDADYLSHAPGSVIQNKQSLVWEPAKKIVLAVDEESKNVWTTARTVQQLLKEEDITINEHDKINISPEKELLPNMTIELEKAFPVVLKNGKDKEEVWSTSTTVADFLQQQDIKLEKLDRVEPSLDEEVSSDQTIRVIRVEKITDVVEEPIDFAVTWKKDNNLEKGTEKIIQEGKEGIIKKEFEVTKENGKEVKRQLVSEDKVKDSENQIVAVGTKVITAQVSRGKPTLTPSTQQVQSKPANDGQQAPSSDGKEIYMSATAYTAECNGCSGVTATGINLRSNPNAKVVAVDPSVIPLGSKVWVEGYGYAVAGDTGGAIKGNRIDLHVPSKGQASSFGIKRVKVRVLN